MTPRDCAAQHFGPWMIEPQWFAQAVSAVKAGTFTAYRENSDRVVEGKNPPQVMSDPNVVGEIDGDFFRVNYYIENGIARVPFFGQVTKGKSSFGGASSVWTRKSVRKAAQDDRVSAILLHIDSPGGTVSGTGDLAADVARINREIKPVYTYFEDLGASAAYWIGSQGRRIFANPTAEVGSIGTMTWVEDTSGMYEKAGIKVHLIATGKFKGQWIDGNPIKDDYLETVRTEINDLNEHFLQGVMNGRKMTRERLMEIADGRVFIAEKARSHGLIDQVASLDAAMQAIRKEQPMSVTREQFNAYAAENPDAVKDYIAQGHKTGLAEGTTTERNRCLSIVQAGGARTALVGNAISTNADPESFKTTVAAVDAEAKAAVEKAEADAKAQNDALAAKEKEIAALKEQIATPAPIGTAAAGKAAQEREQKTAGEGEPKTYASAEEQAKDEWANNVGDCKTKFRSEVSFVAFRKGELAGKIKYQPATA